METDNILGRLCAVRRLGGSSCGGPGHGEVGHRPDLVQDGGRDSERVPPRDGPIHWRHLLRSLPGRKDQEVRTREQALQNLQ